MKTVAIIGGGVTGLSAAYYLNKAIQAERIDANIVLIEAGEKLGGKISTFHDGEFIMETGADSIVTRKLNVPLIEELGLQDDVVYNATGKSFIYIDGQLKPIPDDALFGIPLSLESLAKSELISAEGKVEALKDFYTSNETFTKNDSIGSFLEAFLGKEIVERQIGPVLSGVYSGKLNELTIASTLPYLLDYKNEYGSIIKGLSENKQKFLGKSGGKFMSFKNGVSSLIDRMEERLTGVHIRKRTMAQSIGKDGERYRITLSGGESVEADYVVLATLHHAAQALLRSEELDEPFAGMTNSSLTSVYIGFDVPDSLLPKDGTGFIAVPDSGLHCDACTWTSRKWEHTSENRHLLTRLFYKSSNAIYDKLQRLSEREVLNIALEDIKNSLGLDGEPLTYQVTKWHESMPNYHIQHPHLVRSLESKLETLFPGVLLAGCSYYGVGIPDCIASGEKIAGRIAGELKPLAAPLS